MKRQIEEKLLLYKIMKNQDTEAYGELYDLYIEKIYRFVYFKVHNKEDAEDLTSEVFLKAWQYIREKNPHEVESISGLLFSIARNSIIDMYRERARKPVVSIEIMSEIVAEQKDKEAIDHVQEVARTVELIKRLKQDYQEVLLLKYVEGLKINEIAGVLGKTSMNVRVLLHRAMKKLKELANEK